MNNSIKILCPIIDRHYKLKLVKSIFENIPIAQKDNIYINIELFKYNRNVLKDIFFAKIDMILEDVSKQELNKFVNNQNLTKCKLFNNKIYQTINTWISNSMKCKDPFCVFITKNKLNIKMNIDLVEKNINNGTTNIKLQCCKNISKKEKIYYVKILHFTNNLQYSTTTSKDINKLYKRLQLNSLKIYFILQILDLLHPLLALKTIRLIDFDNLLYHERIFITSYIANYFCKNKMIRQQAYYVLKTILIIQDSNNYYYKEWLFSKLMIDSAWIDKMSLLPYMKQDNTNIFQSNSNLDVSCSCINIIIKKIEFISIKRNDTFEKSVFIPQKYNIDKTVYFKDKVLVNIILNSEKTIKILFISGVDNYNKDCLVMVYKTINKDIKFFIKIDHEMQVKKIIYICANNFQHEYIINCNLIKINC